MLSFLPFPFLSTLHEPCSERVLYCLTDAPSLSKDYYNLKKMKTLTYHGRRLRRHSTFSPGAMQSCQRPQS